jgi:hypothetical protein
LGLVALLVFKTSVTPNQRLVGSIPTRLRQRRPPCTNTVQGGHFFCHATGRLFEGNAGLGSGRQPKSELDEPTCAMLREAAIIADSAML